MSAMDTAIEHYGADMPDWVRVMAEQIDISSQRAVANKINYSTSVISQALKGSYPGNVERVEKAVLGAYAGATVDCPVLGEVEQQECLRWQREPFSSSNSTRVRLYRACHSTCPNRHKED